MASHVNQEPQKQLEEAVAVVWGVVWLRLIFPLIQTNIVRYARI
jgi:hypothetical protein